MPEQVLRWEDDGIAVEALPGIGGRLHRIQAFGVDLLRTPPTPAVHREDPFAWGGFPMAPWCNRSATDPVVVAGRRVELPANFPDGTAIHGQVYAAPWEVVDDATLRIEAGGAGWPWRYEVVARFRVGPASCGLTLELRNLDDAPMPAGIGVHPWFVIPLHLAVPARRVFTDNLVPAVEPQPVEGRFDLRRLGALPEGLDASWTDLTGRSVDLAWPAHGLGATLRFGDQATVVVAARPAGMDAVALEPQTHVHPALRRLSGDEPGAPMVLAPGEALTVTYDLHVDHPAPDHP